MRSHQVSLGRLIWRSTMMSCWRNSRFSAMRADRLRVRSASAPIPGVRVVGLAQARRRLRIQVLMKARIMGTATFLV